MVVESNAMESPRCHYVVWIRKSSRPKKEARSNAVNARKIVGIVISLRSSGVESLGAHQAVCRSPTSVPENGKPKNTMASMIAPNIGIPYPSFAFGQIGSYALDIDTLAVPPTVFLAARGRRSPSDGG